MLLAIDVGNTELKVGLWTGSWRVERRASSALLQNSLAPVLRDMLAGRYLEAAICCCVVPKLEAPVRLAVHAISGVEIAFLRFSQKLGLSSAYTTPETLGADRIANALGLIAAHPLPALAVDFGTATKIEAVDRSGTYLGGAILPGLETAASALFAAGAKLQQVPIEPPPKAIGAETKTALQSGVLLSHASAVDGMIERFMAELGSPAAAVVATGGLSQKVSGLCRRVTTVNPFLTMDGLLEAALRVGLYKRDQARVPT